tara:strand:- start:858 stop:1061 length:204 start_codon:yes stop_codon:yes gene_type:complete
MKKRIFEIIMCFILMVMIVAAVIGGVTLIYYSLINAFLYILMYKIGFGCLWAAVQALEIVNKHLKNK